MRLKNIQKITNNSSVVALHNGNISEIIWKTTDTGIRSYSFQYDKLNRLLSSFYVKNRNEAKNAYNEIIKGYDKNGNILGINRKGENEITNSPEIDILSYTYRDNSNKLLSVTDATTFKEGFYDGNKSGSDYAYDTNGNLIKDLNKGITKISYNHLNLPTEVLWSSTKKINYSYDASGVKIKKVVTDESDILNPTKTTDYLGSFQYLDQLLQFFPTSEGYVNVVSQNGIIDSYSFDYVYNYTDHLGNVRMSYTWDKSTSKLKVLNENNYYPFGLKHKGYISPEFIITPDPDTDNGTIIVGNDFGLIGGGSTSIPKPEAISSGTRTYNYKYNGKELQEEFNINLYDYGARNYDPAIGRWFNVDPMAGKWNSYSPYNFTLNNQINFIDPDGEDVYMHFFVKSDKKEDNSMFWNAALTHARDLLNSGELGEGDIAVFKAVSDLGELDEKVGDIVSSYSSEYGKTKEFGIWSHAGLDGPIGSKPASKDALYNRGDDRGNGNIANNNSSQLSIKGWSNIDFNWAPDSRAYFMGCNTGNDSKKDSFTKNISKQSNFNNVEIWGQPTSSYPSKFTNVRETNSRMREGDFNKLNVYMVSGPPLGLTGRWLTNYANQMNIYKNGKKVKSSFQPGTQKKIK